MSGGRIARPFDAFRAAAELARKVERPGQRRVLRVGAAGACGNAVTIYLSGCMLRCIHCWAGADRDAPERFAAFCSHRELLDRIRLFRRENRLSAAEHRLRLSGGEPIVSRQSLQLIERLSALPGRLFVETNGVLLGARPGWMDRLLACGERVFLKVSLKAGTAEQFERITGAGRSAWEAAWRCVARLHAAGAAFDLNALSLAPALFAPRERRALLDRLDAISPRLRERLQEERLTGYPATRLRMRAAGALPGKPVESIKSGPGA